MQNLHFLLLHVISYLLIISKRLCFCDELLEVPCWKNSECSDLNKHQTDIEVNCVKGFCECNRVNTGERIKCNPKYVQHSNVIGGACPCKVPNAECNAEEDICYCAESYVPSADRRRCINESVELGGVCEVNTQCTAPKLGNNLAICTGTQCQCSEGFAEYNHECRAIVTNDASVTTCQNKTQCLKFEPLAECLLSPSDGYVCLCPQKFVSTLNKTKCIEISDYGNTCFVHQQCQQKLGPGGICNNGACRCDEEHFATQLNATDGTVSTICKLKVVLGSYCRKEEQCHQFHLQESDQSMTCCKGECNCKFGYMNFNNTNCARDSGALALLPGSVFGMLLFATFGLRYSFI